MLDNIYNKKIRPIAISIVKNNDKILVYERKDEITNNSFYRLVGGCIEFGEKSNEALKREFREELSLEIEKLKLLSSFESIFTFNGIQMHEIVFLYESRFKEKKIYDKKSIDGLEGERAFKAIWMPISDFLSEKHIIYPEEVADYL